MERHIPILLESLRTGTEPDFDLYMKQKDQYILYRESDQPFGNRERARLLEADISQLFVHAMDRKNYAGYVEQHLGDLITDKNLPVESRSSLVYESAKHIMDDTFADPRSGDNIKRTGEFITHTIGFVLNEPGSVKTLSAVTSYDYYTYTHSVNVSLFAISLGQALGMKGNDLQTLGQGALLHDVGKCDIDNGIVNKEGPLNDEEFAEMKQHPNYGHKMLEESDDVPADCYVGVLQHHEKLSGAGYPNGLVDTEIETMGRIVAIADVFDAISTKRSYKPALSVSKTLKIMSGMQGHFDPRLFVEFVKLMGKVDMPKRM
jgi:putative nucleotidyltransferase with HDIG domain